MEYIKNRVFALFFAVIIFLWIIWSSIWAEIGFGPVNAPGWPYFDPFHLTLYIVVIGLLYEAYRPSLDFKLNKNKRWTAAGIFLLAIAVIVVVSIMFLEVDEPGQNIFGSRTFEYPLNSGQIHTWPNLLYEFLSVFCMETVSLSLLFGILFMTKSTPEKSKSYNIMLIGAIAFELFLFLGYYLPFFITGVGQSNFTGMTRMKLLTTYWFHWDVWSEIVILAGAIWLMRDKIRSIQKFLMSKKGLTVLIAIVIALLVAGYFLRVPSPVIKEKGLVKIHNQNISGEIKQDQIWSGTIHVTGDIWMDEEVTLTIMPGTTILISAGRDDQNKGNSLSGTWELEKVGPLYTEEYAKSHIEIVGRIIAVGQPDKIIRFTSDSPTPNYADWSEIRLYPNSRIEYSIIEYSGRAGIAWQGHGDIKDANISISNSIIQHVFWGCVSLGMGSWNVVSNTISDCGSEGIDAGPLSGKPYIAGNIITNSTVGIATTRGASPIIENNTLIDNVKGILSRGNDIITHNSISSPSKKIHEQSYMGYTFPYIAEPPVITFTGIQIAENPAVTIEFNEILNNQRGISIGPGSKPTLTIRNNNIYDNDLNIYSNAAVTINAPNNWWGTTNTREVDVKIWDYYDDPSLGKINYIPILYAPVEETGIGEIKI